MAMSDAFESTRTGWRRSYLLFAVLSAFAALFGVPAVPVLWGGGNLIATGLALAVVLAAVAVLCAPGRPRRLLLLSAMQLAGVVAESSAGALWSGEAVMGLLNLTVVIYGVGQLIRRRGRPLDGAALMAHLSPVLRVGSALFYAASFLWKVRHGAALADWINGSLVIEGLAPLLLLLPVTRSWAALGLMAFHSVLGFL
ncbi:MAG TPA: hypothetical protein VNO55_20495, partial [Polyangia bacterium]|nr:hypothetical protein [Polyangia bacterium]